jgi:hypothetical protein
MSGYACVMVGVVDVSTMSISGGDVRPGDQVLGWLARYPRGGFAARRCAGDVSQGLRVCAGLVAVRGFGVDALAFAAKGNRRPIRDRAVAAAAARLRGPPW